MKKFNKVQVGQTPRSIPRHNPVKVPEEKGKEKVLKEARDKQFILYKIT